MSVENESTEPQEQHDVDGAPSPRHAARHARRVREGLGAAVLAALTERLPYKAAALFFSLVLWLVVSAGETAEQIVPVRLAANVDPAIDLVGPTPTVRALVVGRARDLLKIGEGPLVVHRVFTADTPDSVRVELRPGDVDLPAGSGAVVRDVQPRSITLRFVPTPREAARRRSRGHREGTGGGAAARDSAARSTTAQRDSVRAR